MEHERDGFLQAAAVLPPELRQRALALGPKERERVEELRLRVGRPLTAVLPEGECALGGGAVCPQDLQRLLELASRASVHAVLPQLREGFVTVTGGHRVGLCGTAAVEDGRILTLRSLSSACVRVARQFPGIARPVAGALLEEGRLQSTLILAPPGAGKTSLLRDLIRTISEGDGVPPLRVGVADQRGELGAAFQGVPQLELGRRTDLLDGCPKAQGLMMLLRSMNPQVLAVDEVTAPEDVRALTDAGGCGAVLLASVHGAGREDLRRRALYRELTETGLFRRLVTIQGTGAGRRYAVEVLE
ncbi:MAG: stage III sporulation protein AB [Lawsonibacter sp.]|nr:stage III sporulation protein AB [Lawsonibacter sp.]